MPPWLAFSYAAKMRTTMKTKVALAVAVAATTSSMKGSRTLQPLPGRRTMAASPNL